jgi:hypothetical protein
MPGGKAAFRSAAPDLKGAHSEHANYGSHINSQSQRREARSIICTDWIGTVHPHLARWYSHAVAVRFGTHVTLQLGREGKYGMPSFPRSVISSIAANQPNNW